MRFRVGVLMGCLLFIKASVCFGFSFTDVTLTAGVDYRQHSYEEAPNDDRQVYMTGGAAAGDYNGDGWVDLYVTRLDAPDILFENQSGTFVDVTTSAFGPTPMNIASNGAQWGDIDNDGDQDLYVTSIGTTGYQLYVNDGNGQFSEQAAVRNAGVSGSDPHYGMSTSFGDYDLDGYLDIHTTEWREDAQIDYQDLPYNARLLRNAGASNPGHYTDVTVAAGVAMDDVPINGNPLRFEAQSFSSRFTDLDRDGHPDLIVSSDHRTSRLYWNNGDGTFLDGTVAAGVGTDEYGMGSTVGDFDGDGDLDWFVTSIDDDLWQVPQRDGNRLYRNDGNRVFTDATDDAGVRHGDWGWGASFVDFDNDGDWDIAHTNGMDWPSPFYVPLFHEDFIDDPMKVFINDGTGVYTEMSAALGANDVRAGKGLLVFDYDNDGDQDMFITNNGEHPVLYRNDGGNANNWLRVATEGTVSNRDGIGAFVTVVPDLDNPSEVIVTEIDGGNNFMGQNERTAHFGLSDHSTVDLVKIEWPSGIIQTFENVNANTLIQALETVSADFDGDLAIDCGDADALVAAIAAGANAAAFDLDGNGLVDGDDLSVWLSAAGEANLGPGLAFLPGDATLDGTVDGQDFLAWNDHKFTTNAGWCGGDFNGDGITDGGDFLLWNQNKFSSSDHVAVPEPTGPLLCLVGLLAFAARRRP